MLLGLSKNLILGYFPRIRNKNLLNSISTCNSITKYINIQNTIIYKRNFWKKLIKNKSSITILNKIWNKKIKNGQKCTRKYKRSLRFLKVMFFDKTGKASMN